MTEMTKCDISVSSVSQQKEFTQKWIFKSLIVAITLLRGFQDQISDTLVFPSVN